MNHVLKSAIMKPAVFLCIIACCTGTASFANDTLYFRLSNPWNTVKSPTGQYLRKCVKEKDYYRAWDYNSKNILVTESFYTDTSFNRKLFCHKYFDEKSGLLEQSRCYENGQLHGYYVLYDADGDTTGYDIYENGTVIKSWNEGTDNNGDQVIFERIEQLAEFPGGRPAWIKYLDENIIYPQKLKKKISGQMIVQITIDTTGTVSDVKVLKSLHRLLDEEVIRVIMQSPKWKPSRQNGRTVKAITQQPITF